MKLIGIFRSKVSNADYSQIRLSWHDFNESLGRFIGSYREYHHPDNCNGEKKIAFRFYDTACRMLYNVNEEDRKNYEAKRKVRIERAAINALVLAGNSKFSSRVQLKCFLDNHPEWVMDHGREGFEITFDDIADSIDLFEREFRDLIEIKNLRSGLANQLA